MGQRLGRAFIKWDGKLLETLPGAKIDIGGVDRDTVTGSNAVLGYSEKTKPATLECEISLGTQTRLADFAAITNATITFECDTGQHYVMRNAWLTESPNATEGDGGKVPLKFASTPAQEVIG